MTSFLNFCCSWWVFSFPQTRFVRNARAFKKKGLDIAFLVWRATFTLTIQSMKISTWHPYRKKNLEPEKPGWSDRQQKIPGDDAPANLLYKERMEVSRVLKVSWLVAPIRITVASLKLTLRTWKYTPGKGDSYWTPSFLGAMLVWERKTIVSFWGPAYFQGLWLLVVGGG